MSRFDGQVSEINMVPMIDVLLVLLIIFMLQQLLIVEIVVPPPGGSATGNPSNEIVLSLDSAGGYSINTQVVHADSLATELHEIFDERPRKVLLVQSHPSRKYRDVIKAMDVAKGAGVQVLSLLPNQP